MKAKRAREIADRFSTLAKKGESYTVSVELFDMALEAINEYAVLLERAEADSRLSQGNTKWSEEEDARLVKEWASGTKIQKLCEKHMRSASGIIARLNKLGVLKEDDFSGKTRWTVEEDALLTSEFNRGFSLEIMAKRHGRTMSGILGRLEKLGLSDESRYI